MQIEDAVGAACSGRQSYDNAIRSLPPDKAEWWRGRSDLPHFERRREGSRLLSEITATRNSVLSLCDLAHETGAAGDWERVDAEARRIAAAWQLLRAACAGPACGRRPAFAGTVARSRCFNFTEKPPASVTDGRGFVTIYEGGRVVWQGTEGDEPAGYRQGELDL